MPGTRPISDPVGRLTENTLRLITVPVTILLAGLVLILLPAPEARAGFDGEEPAIDIPLPYRESGFDEEDGIGDLPAPYRETGFDAADPGTAPFAPDQAGPEETAAMPEASGDSRTGIPAFLDDTTWTLGAAASLRTGSDAQWIDTHVFVRGVTETLVRDSTFVRLDWKARLSPKSDHRADAKGNCADLEATLREAYVQAGFGNMNLKLGSQIIVWGKADTVAVTDVASPRDMSELIFPELEDMRFGQWALSARWFRDQTNLFVFAAPKPAADRLPDPGTHYFRPVLGDRPADIRDGSPAFGDVEAGARLEILSGKTDMSLVGGRFFANQPVYDFQGVDPVKGLVFKGIYGDFLMAGAAAAHARGNFLFKAELAGKFGLPGQALGGNRLYDLTEQDVLDAAVGIEYNANDQYEAMLEISNRHRFGSPGGLIRPDRNQPALYLTLTKDFFHDTLALTYNYYYRFRDRDQFHHFRAAYDITDAVELRCQYTIFNIRDTESQLWPYRDEDRLAVEIRYAF